MNKFEIKNMGVQLLKADDLSKINGGIWPAIRDYVIIETLKWMLKNGPEVEPGFYHPGKM